MKYLLLAVALLLVLAQTEAQGYGGYGGYGGGYPSYGGGGYGGYPSYGGGYPSYGGGGSSAQASASASSWGK
uniref:Uncharacterized protein n=1 Tax=Pristionchus pacificus TaxID=54126 RepID=A0A2A6CS32_PRIPA|eukprot:PDM80908.1 hypothetical protein PRIPAC_35911 [Pristionchus pacificus]